MQNLIQQHNQKLGKDGAAGQPNQGQGAAAGPAGPAGAQQQQQPGQAAAAAGVANAQMQQPRQNMPGNAPIRPPVTNTTAAQHPGMTAPAGMTQSVSLELLIYKHSVSESQAFLIELVLTL